MAGKLSWRLSLSVVRHCLILWPCGSQALCRRRQGGLSSPAFPALFVSASCLHVLSRPMTLLMIPGTLRLVRPLSAVVALPMPLPSAGSLAAMAPNPSAPARAPERTWVPDPWEQPDPWRETPEQEIGP